MLRTDFVRAQWWIALPVALLSIALFDLALSFWRPHPMRLPDQFSSAYLRDYVDWAHGAHPIVFLGDSVLWGYQLPPQDAAPSLLARLLQQDEMVNLSYEGGSGANSYFMLRYLLARGIHPALVVVGVNSKEGNPGDSAYNRLHPSLEPLVAPLFDASDRRRLVLSQKSNLSARLGRGVESFWRLYRYRTDVRVALFGNADAADALASWLQALTGSQALQRAAHAPTADKFLGTYDLEPAAADNVDLWYLRRLARLVRQEHISTLAFLTPTNHRLLHDYIDSSVYDARLKQLSDVLRAQGIPVLNLDRAIIGEFIDNDHLTAAGNRQLASALLNQMRQALNTR